jgi:hypothetical protein
VGDEQQKCRVSMDESSAVRGSKEAPRRRMHDGAFHTEPSFLSDPRGAVVLQGGSLGLSGPLKKAKKGLARNKIGRCKGSSFPPSKRALSQPRAARYWGLLLLLLFRCALTVAFRAASAQFCQKYYDPFLRLRLQWSIQLKLCSSHHALLCERSGLRESRGQTPEALALA